MPIKRSRLNCEEEEGSDSEVGGGGGWTDSEDENDRQRERGGDGWDSDSDSDAIAIGGRAEEEGGEEEESGEEEEEGGEEEEETSLLNKQQLVSDLDEKITELSHAQEAAQFESLRLASKNETVDRKVRASQQMYDIAMRDAELAGRGKHDREAFCKAALACSEAKLDRGWHYHELTVAATKNENLLNEIKALEHEKSILLLPLPEDAAIKLTASERRKIRNSDIVAPDSAIELFRGKTHEQAYRTLWPSQQQMVALLSNPVAQGGLTDRESVLFYSVLEGDVPCLSLSCLLRRRDTQTHGIFPSSGTGKSQAIDYLKTYHNAIECVLDGSCESEYLKRIVTCARDKNEWCEEVADGNEVEEYENTGKKPIYMKKPVFVWNFTRSNPPNAKFFRTVEAKFKATQMDFGKFNGGKARWGSRPICIFFANASMPAEALEELSGQTLRIYLITSSKQLIPDPIAPPIINRLDKERREEQLHLEEEAIEADLAKRNGTLAGYTPTLADHSEVDSCLTDCQKEFARILRQKQQAGTLMAYEISDDLVGLKYNEIKLMREGKTFKVRAIDRVDNFNKKVGDAYRQNCK